MNDYRFRSRGNTEFGLQAGSGKVQNSW